MFISRHFENFVHNQSVQSVFRDCFLKYSTCEINANFFFCSANFAEEVRCKSKIKLANPKLNLLRFFTKVSENRSLCQNCFYGKIVCYTVLQSVQLCIPQQLFQQEILFIKVLNIVVMVSKRIIKIRLFSTSL